MKRNNQINIMQKLQKKKLEKMQPNANQYIKYSSNIIINRNYYKTYINKNESPIKDKEEIKKEKYAVNLRKIPRTHIYDNKNDLMKSYSLKKIVKYKNKENYVNNIRENNFSGYKQILNKLIEQYASNENSKENINNLLKRNIINQKTLLMKKSKIFSPRLKKNASYNKNELTKKIYNTGENRSIKKKNDFYTDNIIKLQAFWRGYFLRKIVVKGLKKYYGLIFIYRLLKKYLVRRNINVFKIIFGRKLIINKKKSFIIYSPLKNNFVYSKKLFYSNDLINSERSSFSFSNGKNENEKKGNNINEKLRIKTFYSKDKSQKTINSYNHIYTEINANPKNYKNRLIYSAKEIYINSNNKNQDTNMAFSINKNYDSNILTSSVIKEDEKNIGMGRITINFFKKYGIKEKEKEPIDNNINNEYYFRKSIYKKVNKNKKYIYVHKNLNQKDDKDNSPRKINKSNNYNLYNTYNNYKSKEIKKYENKFKINRSFYNIYKFVFSKLINVVKKKYYKKYFDNFIYQLKIRRKIQQIKLYNSKLLSIILKIEKKILKKYLDIYRENVLILKANELIKNENNNNIIDNKNKIKNEENIGNIINNKKDVDKNVNNIKIYKNSNLNNIKCKYDKKDILKKLLNVKDKYIKNFLKKYFNKWETNSNNIISKNNSQYSNNTFNNYKCKTINNENNKITVNKKKLKIKRQYNIHNINNSQNGERKSNNSSKEKKMKIIKRISKPNEYLLLYNSYNKNIRDSYKKLNSYDIFNDEIKNVTINKIFSIINKLESKKILFKYFISWKKNK